MSWLKCRTPSSKTEDTLLNQMKGFSTFILCVEIWQELWLSAECQAADVKWDCTDASSTHASGVRSRTDYLPQHLRSSRTWRAKRQPNDLTDLRGRFLATSPKDPQENPDMISDLPWCSVTWWLMQVFLITTPLLCILVQKCTKRIQKSHTSVPYHTLRKILYCNTEPYFYHCSTVICRLCKNF